MRLRLAIEAGGVAGGGSAPCDARSALSFGQEAERRHGVAVEAGGLPRWQVGLTGSAAMKAGVPIAVGGGDGDDLRHMTELAPGPQAPPPRLKKADPAGPGLSASRVMKPRISTPPPREC